MKEEQAPAHGCAYRPLPLTRTRGEGGASGTKDAPGQRLALDPVLPDWLPELELRCARIGKRRIDLRFWRDGEATRFAAQGDTAGLAIERHPIGAPSFCRGGKDAA